MSFFGSIGNYITPALQAVGGAESGRLQGAIEKIKLDKQARDDQLKAILQGATVRNLDSEVNARDNPKPKYDADRGVMVSEGGVATPVEGIEPKPKAPLPGSPEWKADLITQAKISNQYGYHPPVTGYSPVVTTAADGSQHVSAFGTKTGSIRDTGVTAKAATGIGGGIGSLSPQAVQAMYDQASQADKVMRDYENDYRAGKVKVHTGSQTLGAGTGAHSTGLTALVTGAEAAASNAMLGVTDPKYQAYLTAQKRFGNIMGNLMSKRYSEYQGTLDTQLAGLSANDAGPTLDLKQSYRSDLLNHRPAGGTTAAAKTGGPSGDINLGGDPTAQMSDADAWEYYVEHGKSKKQATAAVEARGH